MPTSDGKINEKKVNMMNKYIFNFGRVHLPAFNVDPQEVALVAETEDEARDIIFNTPEIGFNFCMSYPYTEKRMSEFKNKWNMKEYTLEELFEKKKC